jgi:hypothetical protein
MSYTVIAIFDIVFFLIPTLLIIISYKNFRGRMNRASWPVSTGQVTGHEKITLATGSGKIISGKHFYNRNWYEFEFLWNITKYSEKGVLMVLPVPAIGESVNIRFNPDNPSKVIPDILEEPFIARWLLILLCIIFYMNTLICTYGLLI